MFKKIEIWVLYLVLLLAFLFAIFFGVLVRQELAGSIKLGKVSQAALFLAEIPKNMKIIFENVKDKGNDMSVKVDRHYPKKGFINYKNIEKNFLLILPRYDGDLSRGVVELIDIKDQKVIHTWLPDINKINQLIDTDRIEFQHLERDQNLNRYLIMNPIIMKNGDIIFQSSSPLVKTDLCNNLVWLNQDHVFHHSNTLGNDKFIWVPINIFPYTIDKDLVGETYGNYIDDGIAKINNNSGRTIYIKSVSEILIENGYKHLIFSQSNYLQDPIHLNDIEPALFDGEYWNKGDIFLSLRNLSMIIHYRPIENKIINIITGEFFNQHDVDIISDHEISIFNNNVFHTIDGLKLLNNSEIVIYDFKNNSFRKEFNDTLISLEMKTIIEGLHQFLNDGSILIEEQQDGRLIFLDNLGNLSWEYVNRASNGKVYDINWSRIIENNDKINAIKEAIKNKKC